MRQFSCEKCGNVRYVLVDGHVVGDHLLEGVMFQVSITTAGELEVAVTEEFAEYFKRFDSEYFFSEIKEYVEDNLDDSIGECLHCEGDITFEDAPRRNRPYPWKCPECKTEDAVWPHPEHNMLESDGKTYAKCSMCEKCGEKLMH